MLASEQNLAGRNVGFEAKSRRKKCWFRSRVLQGEMLALNHSLLGSSVQYLLFVVVLGSSLKYCLFVGVKKHVIYFRFVHILAGVNAVI